MRQRVYLRLLTRKTCLQPKAGLTADFFCKVLCCVSDLTWWPSWTPVLPTAVPSHCAERSVARPYCEAGKTMRLTRRLCAFDILLDSVEGAGYLCNGRFSSKPGGMPVATIFCVLVAARVLVIGLASCWALHK